MSITLLAAIVTVKGQIAFIIRALDLQLVLAELKAFSRIAASGRTGLRATEDEQLLVILELEVPRLKEDRLVKANLQRFSPFEVQILVGAVWKKQVQLVSQKLVFGAPYFNY